MIDPLSLALLKTSILLKLLLSSHGRGATEQEVPTTEHPTSSCLVSFSSGKLN